MEKSIEELIYESSMRIRLYRASLTKKDVSDLSDKELLLLELLSTTRQLSIQEIVSRYSSVSKSTISITLTKLWRKKLIDKAANPENQRVKDVKLTSKGLRTLEELKKTRADVYKAIIDSLKLDKSEEKTFKRILYRSIDYFDGKLKLQ